MVSPAQVNTAFEPETETELRLALGQIVLVTQQDDSGWWEGYIEGTPPTSTGWFPADFVTLLPAGATATAAAAAPAPAPVVPAPGTQAPQQYYAQHPPQPQQLYHVAGQAPHPPGAPSHYGQPPPSTQQQQQQQQQQPPPQQYHHHHAGQATAPAGGALLLGDLSQKLSTRKGTGAPIPDPALNKSHASAANAAPPPWAKRGGTVHPPRGGGATGAGAGAGAGAGVGGGSRPGYAPPPGGGVGRGTPGPGGMRSPSPRGRGGPFRGARGGGRAGPSHTRGGGSGPARTPSPAAVPAPALSAVHAPSPALSPAVPSARSPSPADLARNVPKSTSPNVPAPVLAPKAQRVAPATASADPPLGAGFPGWTEFCDTIEQLLRQARSKAHASAQISEMCGGGAALPAGLSADTALLAACSMDGRVHVSDQNDQSMITAQQCAYALLFSCVAQKNKDKGVACTPESDRSAYLSMKPGQQAKNAFTDTAALILTSELFNQEAPEESLREILTLFDKAAGQSNCAGCDLPTVLHMQERATDLYAAAYHLKAIGHLQHISLSDVPRLVELVLMIRSLEVSARSSAIVAATIANSGRCPVSKKTAFSKEVCAKLRAQIEVGGLSSTQQKRTFVVGGESGVLWIVVPGIVGLSLIAPGLQDRGMYSSVGIEFSRLFTEKFSS